MVCDMRQILLILVVIKYYDWMKITSPPGITYYRIFELDVFLLIFSDTIVPFCPNSQVTLLQE
jgi:hypothetical protein